MFPGSNLLAEAFMAIDPTEVQYLRYKGRTINDVMQYVPEWDAPLFIEASVQAVPRSRYVHMGLDFQKKYITVYCEREALGLDRERTGDRFVTPDGQLWQVESETNWFGIDGGWQGVEGWTGVVAVQVLMKPPVAPPDLRA